MLLIGIAGPARSGKGLLANVILEEFTRQELRARIRSFADPLKRITGEFFSLDPDQLWGERKDQVDLRYGWTPRHALQQLGDALLALDPKIIVLGPRSPIHAQGLDAVIIQDVRNPEEAREIRARGGFVAKIVGRRPPVSGAGHRTEARFEEIEADVVIINNRSLVEYQTRCQQVAEQLVARVRA